MSRFDVKLYFKIYAAWIWLAISCCACFTAYPLTAQAADINAGRQMAAQCSVCHGVDGIATLAEAPNLAGQSAIYLSEQLKNYRSGKRSHEVMNVISKALTDQEVDDLAAWYMAIKISATLPP